MARFQRRTALTARTSGASRSIWQRPSSADTEGTCTKHKNVVEERQDVANVETDCDAILWILMSSNYTVCFATFACILASINSLGIS